ncbi:DUF488 family protein [Allonocardiopsis opalescens]|uniref:Uncharacterized protein DUF488 n=1 Tax=Allonocardiopsis opalescens TaxID=1144618 RepID=A0A2T0QAH1_9ACTN|nr:DUF488 domain-containing protein [Allonocardiopsis opalescens]PRY00888.1 uncharacterized protein DUF488 [Allonocardiopsis opalescens]
MDVPLFSTSGAIGVGYEGTNIDDFISDLLRRDVSLLVDVRLTPISRKTGLSKTKLRDRLVRHGIRYLHTPALGNPKWNRPGFSGTREELTEARGNYYGLIAFAEAAGWIDAITEEAKSQTVALMCFEAAEERCHRSVLLEEIRRRLNGLAAA